jgi:hypothetical protein
MIHLLAYDLTTPNNRPEDYDRVLSTIKADFDSWCHIEQSVWLVDMSMGAGVISAVFEKAERRLNSCYCRSFPPPWPRRSSC